MSQITVEARGRAAANKNANRRLRASGMIPAVVYGPGKEPVPVTVDPARVKEVLVSQSGQNTIFTLNVEGRDPATVMVKDYQLDPVRGNLIHADLLQIAMDQVLELTVEIEIVGEAVGVKVDKGILDIVTREIEVECLPADIPESIKIDVSHLKINEYIRVKDIVVDPKVTILSEPDVVIVTVVPPIKEEVAAEAPAAPAEPELIKKGKAVEEEGAEPEAGGKSKGPKIEK